MTHTHGPWEVVALNGFGPYAIRMPTPAGAKHPTYYGIGQIGSVDDARLIAAAPELLEALIDLLEAYEGYDRFAQAARDAIAKATTP